MINGYSPVGTRALMQEGSDYFHGDSLSVQQFNILRYLEVKDLATAPVPGHLLDFQMKQAIKVQLRNPRRSRMFGFVHQQFISGKLYEISQSTAPEYIDKTDRHIIVI